MPPPQVPLPDVRTHASERAGAEPPGREPPGAEPPGAELPGPRARFARPPARQAAVSGRRARPREPVGPARRGRSTAARIIAVAVLVLAIAAIWFVVELFQPFQSSGRGSVVVTVPAGASTGTIGDELARRGVISSSFFFGLRATLDGERGKLRAGTYHLKHGMSYGAVLSVLTTPPPAAPTTEVTIIPGRTRRQIAHLLHQQGVHGRFMTDTRHTTLLSLPAYGAPRHLSNLEGFLFPSTYQLREPISISALVNDQLTTFRQQFATVNMAYARSKNLTPYDVLIIASMVEAEAGTAHDRPLIASVIYNRLRDHMALGIDATIRYAVNNYTSPLTDSQLGSPSLYNTRTHLGLPPTPIDNPSLSSIEAAAHPAHTNYLYFVAKPCGNGASAFASTNAQFQLEVQRYDQARAQRGGRSPLKC
ncbi:MAG TPA: endolytic transglycosylase MltG [Solirubrobacteraceae bacterium]|nr:endolytic transglycosylase MltG [Solirubrobacteraceae bacterium]